MPGSGLERADGSVRIHHSLITPDRKLVGTIDRMHLLFIMGEVLFVGFASLYLGALGPSQFIIGPLHVDGWAFAIGLFGLNALFLGRYVQFLHRMGKRGGYYTEVHSRTVREQPVYRRSAHPSAPTVLIRDQQRM